MHLKTAVSRRTIIVGWRRLLRVRGTRAEPFSEKSVKDYGQTSSTTTAKAPSPSLSAWKECLMKYAF